MFYSPQQLKDEFEKLNRPEHRDDESDDYEDYVDVMARVKEDELY